MGFVIADAPWLGSQTVLERWPPALMEAGAEGRRSASLFGALLNRAGHRATQGEAFAHSRYAPKGLLRDPERKLADSLTPNSGQLSLAATRHAAQGLKRSVSRFRFVPREPGKRKGGAV
jgi:hypothetical protein